MLKRLQPIIIAITLIGTVAFSAAVSFLSEINNYPSEQLLKWVLIILTFIGGTLLIERFFSTRTIERDIADIQQRIIQGNPGCLQTRSQRLSVAEIGKEARTIDILAWTGNVFMHEYEGFLRRRIQQGGRVRFLILDPEGIGVKLIIENGNRYPIDNDIRTTIGICQEFATSLGAASGSFELRKMKWIAPYGMVIIDKDLPGAQLSLGLHPASLRVSASEQRYITLNSTESREHLNYFTAQYDELWNTAETIVSSRAQVG